MAPCMGPMSPVRAYSLWAGLCPEKLVKLKLKLNLVDQAGKMSKLNYFAPFCKFVVFWSNCHGGVYKAGGRLLERNE